MAASIHQPKQQGNNNTGEEPAVTKPSFHASTHPEKAASLDEPRPLVSISESSKSEADLPSPPMKPSSQSSISRLIKSWEQSWVLEVVMLCLGCAAFASVSIVLSFYDGKPLNAWAVGVSISTVISILGTASRVSLAFVLSSCLGQSKWNWFQRNEESLSVFVLHDEAAKGPGGSLKLLWWAKFRYVLSAPRYVSSQYGDHGE
jgi:hypothetical protein